MKGRFSFRYGSSCSSPFTREVPLRTSISSPATPTTRLMSFWSSFANALEDHHVAPLGIGEAVDELVRQDPVSHQQCRHHALRGDAKRFEDEGAHDAEDQHEGDQDGEAELGEARPSLLSLPLPAYLAPAL